MPSSRPNPHRIKTMRVVTLSLSAFVFNTSEFIPVALLSDIGTSFGKTADETGIIITIYAWVVAVLSLPAMLMTANVERKRLLCWLFGIFVLSHVVSVFANHFYLFVASRVGVAISHAIFWSITASLVVKVAPKGKQTWALGLLATGSALATVLGLPLGRLLGQSFGWQATFGAIGLFGLMCVGLIVWVLPTLPSQNAGSLKSLPKLIKCTPLMVVYVAIMLLVTAHFTAYSYIEPLLLDANFSPTITTLMLLWFGVAGIVGSALFGRYYERSPYLFLLSSVVMLLLCLVILSAIAPAMNLMPTVILVLFWGIGMIGIALALQFKTLKLAPKDTDVAMSLFSGIYNIGIGGGAFLGSAVISSLGLFAVGYVGAGVGFLALVALIFFKKSFT